MMSGLVYDSSAYIDSFRRKDYSTLHNRNIVLKGEVVPIYLNAVVLSELLAGAVESKSKSLLEKIEKQFNNLGRLIVPTKNDWSICGHILSQIGKKHGFDKIGRSRMTNDCLIATSTRRLGLTLVTLNRSDFQMISEIRPFNILEV